ncbi:MAG: leucine-rich repeat protein [Oscillospiraceae bacterium]|nr:leucine-rich repeat protein [Oscillospiraceae bacterium]
MEEDDKITRQFRLGLSEDGTSYSAQLVFNREDDRIVIPEEYHGTPITEVYVGWYSSDEPIHTICVSKNVKLFLNTGELRQDQPYFVEISPENPWLCADDKAVFSKDKTILYAFTARNDESYTIPDSVRNICHSAFYNTNNLKELNFPEELDRVGAMAFTGCGVRELRLPKKIKRVERIGFGGIIQAEKIFLPESIEDFVAGAFDNISCSSCVYIPDFYSKPEFGVPNGILAPEYIIDENSKTLCIIDGVVYSKDMRSLLAISKNASDVITVPDGVEVIGVQAGIKNDNVREIILPKSVHTIMEFAFDSSVLEKIDLENVKFIGDGAFNECKNLIETGKIGAESIGEFAFSMCGSLGSVYLTSARELGFSAFSDVKDGAQLFLPEGLEKLGELALKSNFKSVRIPRSASGSENFLQSTWREVELYDVEDSIIYKEPIKEYIFCPGCLVKVLSPDTDEIMYAMKIFEPEELSLIDDGLWSYISSLFGNGSFFDLKSYDEYFRTLSDEEYIMSKYEAAYYRIKYPAELTDAARETYLKYLEDNAFIVLNRIMCKEDVRTEEITDFPYLYGLREKELIELVTRSAEHKLTEITLFLMNYKNERFPLNQINRGAENDDRSEA